MNDKGVLHMQKTADIAASRSAAILAILLNLIFAILHAAHTF